MHTPCRTNAMRERNLIHIARSLFIGSLFLVIMSGCSSAEISILGIINKTYPEESSQNEVSVETEIENAGVFEGGATDGGSLSGLIIAADSTLLPHAQVSFLMTDSKEREDVWKTFEADGAGNFTIRNLAAGTYQLACIYPGYHLQVIRDLQVSRGLETPAITVVLQPAL